MATLKVDLIVDDKGSLVVQGFGNKVDRVMWSARGSVSSLAAELKVAGVATAGVITSLGLVGSKITAISDDYTLLNNQLTLVTDSTTELADVQAQLYEISLDTHQGFGSSVKLLANLDRATEEYGYTQQQVLDITKTVNEAVLVSGRSAASSAAGIQQLGQGLGAGALRGDEFNSVLENTPRIARMLTDEFGVSTGALRKMAEAGELTTEKVVGALLNQSAKVHQEFSTMSVTVGQSWGDVKTVMSDIVFGGTEAAGVTATLSGHLQGFVSYLRDNREEIVSFFEAGVGGAMAFSQELISMGRDAKPYLEGTFTALESLYTAADNIGDLGGPNMGEWGIIGYALLRGGPQAAAVTAALITINNQLEHYGLNIGSLIESSQGFAEHVGNMLDVINGKKDWNTGETIVGRSADQIKQEIAALQATIDQAGDPVGGFFRKIFTGSEISADQAASLERLRQQMDRLKSELTGVAQATEDTPLLLDPTWEGPAPALKQGAQGAAELSKSLIQVKPAIKGVKQELDALSESNRSFLDTGQQIGVEMFPYLTETAEQMDVLTANIVDTSDQAQQSTEQMTNYWAEFSEAGKGEVYSLVRENITDFESLEQTARDVGESIVSVFADMVARILSNWAASGIMGLFSGQGLGGFSVANLVGGFSGSAGSAAGAVGNGFSIAAGVDKVKDWFSFGEAAAESGAGAATATYLKLAGADAASVGSQSALAATTYTKLAGADAIGGSQLLSNASAGVSALGTASMVAPFVILPALDAFGLLGSTTPKYDDMPGVVAQESGDYFTDLTNSIQGSTEALKVRIDAEEQNTMSLDLGATRVRALSNIFDDSTATMALGVDGSVESMDMFLDTMSGWNVSMEDSATVLWLAREAADGNTAAVGALQNMMLELAPTSESAYVGVMGVIAALNELSATDVNIDVKVNQTVVDSVTSNNRVLEGNVSDLHYSASDGQLYGWEYSDWLQSNHAVGGIFTSPTLLTGADGRLHQVAEAGQSEAILPLRNPQQISMIEDKLNLLLGAMGRDNVVNIHHQTVLAGHVIDERVDQLIVKRNTSGADPLQRIT